VYWNLAGAQNWSANAWATTSTGTPSTDNFPLPQDTATFTNAGSVTGTISLDNILYVPNVDMSGRTSAMTLSLISIQTVYGNWTNGSGTTLSNIQPLTFSGGATQTITSAGKTFPCSITINTYGGTVQLADALNIGSNTLTVTNGTFTTAGYAVTTGSLASSNSNVRAINLGASTVTLATNGTSLVLSNALNLTFNAGTSNIISNAQVSGVQAASAGGSIVQLHNYSTTNSNNQQISFSGQISFNNLSCTSRNFGILPLIFSNSTSIGTLTCLGTNAVARFFIQSGIIGTPVILTVGTLTASDCDFRDITLTGAASGASPTRAGDCGGNTGVTFPAPKTVYWNLAGAQQWSATA
jgi:hypothetical protein